jgi:hypothetical protein
MPNFSVVQLFCGTCPPTSQQLPDMVELVLLIRRHLAMRVEAAPDILA